MYQFSINSIPITGNNGDHFVRAYTIPNIDEIGRFQIGHDRLDR